jgi:hypothetical protein
VVGQSSARQLELRLGHAGDLAAAAADQIAEDLLAGGVAALAEREADLVTERGVEAPIATEGGGQIEPAIEELPRDREGFVATAGPQLGRRQRVAVPGRRVGRLADETQDGQRALGILALLQLGGVRAETVAGRLAVNFTRQRQERVGAGPRTDRATNTAGGTNPGSARHRRGHQLPRQLFSCGSRRGERTRPWPEEAREQPHPLNVTGGEERATKRHRPVGSRLERPRCHLRPPAVGGRSQHRRQRIRSGVTPDLR